MSTILRAREADDPIDAGRVGYRCEVEQTDGDYCGRYRLRLPVASREAVVGGAGLRPGRRE